MVPVIVHQAHAQQNSVSNLPPLHTVAEIEAAAWTMIHTSLLLTQFLQFGGQGETNRQMWRVKTRERCPRTKGIVSLLA